MDTYTVSTGKSTVTYTRMRVPFINNGSFYFKLYKSGFFSDIGKVFSNRKIRELITIQPRIRLEIKKSEVLEGLELIGSASDEAPNVQLY